jgi:tetratricopeptide (TPR) repeat protein
MTTSNTSPQTILFLAANPKGTAPLRLDQELRDVSEGLQRAQERDQFKLEKRSAVRPRDIQRAMLDLRPQIIHFSGHGTGEAGLVFEDEIGNSKLVDGDALAALFELFADQLNCVVLNGCYSEVQAQVIAQHISYVIGMNKVIGDKAAITFAVGFYDALGAGRDVEFAFKLGCAAIRLEGIAEYLTPILIKKPVGAGDEVKVNPTSQPINSDTAEPIDPIPHNLPRSSVGKNNFFGRDENLKQLHIQLWKGDRIASVAGMGGIGKTELALQYTKAQVKGNQYPAGICWLSARDQNIATQIVDFAQIHLNLNFPEQLKDDARIMFCWKHWPQGEALVVFDDVTNYDAIKPYLPADSRFKVLITTRLDLGSSFEKVPIEELDSESAIALLESFPGVDGRIKAQLVDAQALCNRVGYLPLALELLGRFLAKKLDWSIDRLLKALEDQGLNATALVQTEDGMTRQLGVKAVLELSWQELNEAEQELACLLGMFAIAPIPWSLVESCQPEVEPDDLEDIRDDGLIVRSLLKRVGEGSYQLHQIVQEYFRIKLGERGDQGQTIKAIFWQVMVGIARDIDERSTINQIEQVRKSIAHLEEGVRSWINSITDEDLTWPFVGIGHFYQGQGNYSFAEPWQKDCLEVTKKRLGEKHASVAVSLHNLAIIYRHQGEYTKAEPLFLSALEINQCLSETESLVIAMSLKSLAGLYRLQGRYEEAEPRLLSALEMFKHLLGEEHHNVINSTSDLAMLYHAQERYAEAKPLFCWVLEISKRLWGEEHPDVAKSAQRAKNVQVHFKPLLVMLLG